MICRTIVFYVAVQSVVVFASPVASLQHNEPIVSPFFYHPTPTSKARGLPEVAKLPIKSKFTPAGSSKLTPGNNHPTRSGRNPIIDTYQTQKPRNIHGRFLQEEPYQKPRSQISDEERAEKINSNLEKMIQFMTVLGQIDRYVSSKAKSIVSTLGRAMENNPDDHYNDKDSLSSSFDY
ncbi:Hypothetical protein CINCED_3A019549 [Cinara cedri]|uniref:Uncharacterized protein n=1 Tax=Cinara cedri TaxID=506608 RepID=A0A5E4MF60_9HEMI|nr:Hypothetical protein CINCED_3A019549 [Cinara cedri]